MSDIHLDGDQDNRDEAPATTETRSVASTSRIPKKIGQFQIKDVLASGGMGTVYRAFQERPRRTVAIKVMKQGIASPSALRRFEYESQVLARLRHPGIAQVYEVGTFDDGTGAAPFFAMEYIPNAKSITQFANDKNLETDQRMEMFTRVCQAVHHGHQKAIIHRDLKPANILVDSQGEVKIIDFGVAIKVMKQGIASPSALRRFEYESQVLARLRHPGIAQVYEVGTFDDGTGAAPFFAMEYIPNAKSITQFANDKNLETDQRMEMFDGHGLSSISRAPPPHSSDQGNEARDCLALRASAIRV